MLTVIVGLTSAIAFGAADFLGGIASKRLHPVLATAIAALVGLVLLMLALPFVNGHWSPEVIVIGALSGVCGAAAIGLLYACLAIGPMSILSPLTAVISAIVPLAIGLAGGDRLGVLGYVALGIALIAVLLVGFVPEKNAVRPSLKGVLMAIGSGIAIGGSITLFDLAPDDSGLAPLVLNRGVNAAIMFSLAALLALIALRRGEPRRPEALWRKGLVFVIACGIVDAAANVGLLMGVRLGELSVMAVLTALYPAGTIILAAIVLKERIAWVQYVGLALAILAAAMLALK